MKAASVFNIPKIRKSVQRDLLDPELLVVEHNVELPGSVRTTDSKYDAKFSQLKANSAIRCEPGEVCTIAHALRKQIAAGRWPALKGCRIAQAKRCEDGHARVFVFKK